LTLTLLNKPRFDENRKAPTDWSKERFDWAANLEAKLEIGVDPSINAFGLKVNLPCLQSIAKVLQNKTQSLIFWKKDLVKKCFKRDEVESAEDPRACISETIVNATMRAGPELIQISTGGTTEGATHTEGENWEEETEGILDYPIRLLD
jgi:hypothetical protein